MSAIDWARFTNVEVWPVARHTDGDGRDWFEECAPDDPALTAWGVYVIDAQGHALHVADCGSQAIASFVSGAIIAALGQRAPAST